MAKRVEDVLIVKSAALGDVLRTTSLLPAARRRGRRVWWLTSRGAADLLKGNPLIDKVFTLERPPRRRFGLVLSLEEEPAFAAAAARLCGGELVGIFPKDGVLAYTSSSARYYDMSLLNPDPGGGHARADRLKKANRLTYGELWLSALGFPRVRRRPILRLSNADRRFAARWLKRAGVARAPIGLNAGAGSRWPSKQLSEERAAEIAAALKTLGREVILLGGDEERARNARVAKASGALAAPLAPLRSFAGLVERCAAVVTTDSLALHVATALGRPTVVLVGPTSSAELDVYGRGEKLTAPACACFYKPRCARARHCLEDIPVERIARAVRKWL